MTPRPRTWDLYCMALSEGPLVLLRMPEHGQAWRPLVQRIGDILIEHGLRKSQLLAVDGVAGRPAARPGWPYTDRQLEEDRMQVTKLEAAFGDPPSEHYASFWLYRWNPEQQRFLLHRRPTKEHL